MVDSKPEITDSAVAERYNYEKQGELKSVLGADFVPVGATRHRRAIGN